ncbi:MAG: hypothetical protein QOH00_1017 [Gaiellales bacterium]|nr:hypothetical protein [Gaiellales bacterium]
MGHPTSMADGPNAGIEKVVDELLAIPPEQFTQARNATVKRLRAEGRRDAAEAVKELPRPPLSLWALNQLARREPSLIETFLRSAGDLREAHRSGGDIRAAAAPEREAEARVVSAAAELARGDVRKVTEAVTDRLRQTAPAAAADAEIATALRAGRLTREPTAPSIDELLGSMPQAAVASTRKAPRQRDHAAERRSLQEEIAAARSAASRAREEARAAAGAARQAQREWERSEKLAERTQQHREAAELHLQSLQQRLGEL